MPYERNVTGTISFTSAIGSVISILIWALSPAIFLNASVIFGFCSLILALSALITGVINNKEKKGGKKFKRNYLGKVGFSVGFSMTILSITTFTVIGIAFLIGSLVS